MRFATLFALSASTSGFLATGADVEDIDSYRSTIILSNIPQPTQNPGDIKDWAAIFPNPTTSQPQPEITLNIWRPVEAEKLTPRLQGKYMGRPLTDAQDCIRSRATECFDMVDINKAPGSEVLQDCMYNIAKQCGSHKKEKRNTNMKSPVARGDGDDHFSDVPCFPTCKCSPNTLCSCNHCKPGPAQDTYAPPPLDNLPPVLIEPTNIAPNLNVDALKECYEELVEKCTTGDNAKDDPESIKKSIKCAENVVSGCSFDMLADRVY